jgi:tetratricopeptide (TPR) repeat protein
MGRRRRWRSGRWGASRLAGLLGLLGVLIAGPASAAKAEAKVLDEQLCAPLPPSSPGDKPKKLSKKQKKELEQNLEKARAAYDAHKFDEAAVALRAVYVLEPSQDILFNLAQACREAGRLALALPLYEQVQAQTQDQAARTDAQRYIAELRGKLAEQEAGRAAQLASSQDHAGAAAAWQAAHGFRPDAVYLLRRAQALQKAGQTAGALDQYQRFLDAGPPAEQAAEARSAIAGLRAAEEDERATKLSEAGKYKEAAASWQQAYNTSPQPLYLFRLAEAQRQSGDKATAIGTYDAFLKACPKNENRELRKQAEEAIVALRTGGVILSGRVAPKKTPVYKKWWFWTAIGVGVVGGSAAIYASNSGSSPPETSLNHNIVFGK